MASMPEREPEQAMVLLPDGSMIPESECQLWTPDGRMVRMYTREERVTTRTDADGTVIRSVKGVGPWHPRWCLERWCTAWSGYQPARHRSDPSVFTGADHVFYSVFVEANEYGSEVSIRLVGAPFPYRGNWWEPDDSYADVILTLREAERIGEALTEVLAEVRAELAPSRTRRTTLGGLGVTGLTGRMPGG